ncbi:MAG: N-acetyltransferase [Candidatus Omnitrophica bacterium]|nr:N-acetyltransferase [Candidatus Omnitrophota bacterium]
MIRKAKIDDIKQIQTLINCFAEKNLMLARSLNELYENIRDFWVFVEDKKILGCAALHISWETLAEIKSLAVKESAQGRGIGKDLISACIKEARELGAKRIFVLTYRYKYFQKLGFKRVKHTDLPHKVWAECINCPKFPNCQEVALLKNIAK